jgi:glycosyltransferase involved in cell wall biosynthesis
MGMSSKHKPSVSVVIPTFNEEANLATCLIQFRSISKETVEIVVSDDGSADKTVDIARKYTDVLVKRPSGISLHTIARNRNAGAERASGRVLIFIDADTSLENPSEFIYQVSKYFSAQPKLVALVVKVKIDPRDAKLSDKLVHGYINLQYKLGLKLGIAGGGGQCQIVRADTFRAVSGYNQQLTASEDIDLIRRVKKLGSVRFASDLVVYESPRRYREQGYVRTLTQWLVNYISVLFRGRAHSKSWKRTH